MNFGLDWLRFSQICLQGERGTRGDTGKPGSPGIAVMCRFTFCSLKLSIKFVNFDVVTKGVERLRTHLLANTFFTRDTPKTFTLRLTLARDVRSGLGFEPATSRTVERCSTKK